MDDFPPVSYEEWKAEAHAVILEESRPLSKEKRWRVKEIVERAPEL